jgi:uncharacterized protein YukE
MGAGSGSGYSVSRTKMFGQAGELDGCGDNVEKSRAAVDPGMCYAPDTLGGSDVSAAFDSFSGAWDAEATTLKSALYELAAKVRLASAKLHSTDHKVGQQNSSVYVPDTQHSVKSAANHPPSALSSY